ncbi:hypothetical protein C0J52_13947 [Blattella germanica]|nr:hypothetical protein C0J52_13947 [Blattella germanica]
MHTAIDNITAEIWLSCVQHAEKLQEEDFEKEVRRDEVLERIIVNLGPDSDNSDNPLVVLRELLVHTLHERHVLYYTIGGEPWQNYLTLKGCIRVMLTNHFEKALSKVTVENWKNACDHVRKEEDFYWERDGMIDEAIDNFVINFDDSESDTDVSDNDEEDREESPLLQQVV